MLLHMCAMLLFNAPLKCYYLGCGYVWINGIQVNIVIYREI